MCEGIITNMKNKQNEKIFISITNKDIFEQIVSLRNDNTKQHEEILLHQKETNGKVKRNYLISMGAISLTVVLLGFLFTYVGLS